jgi:hypothetical protein
MKRFRLVFLLALALPLGACGVFGPDNEEQLDQLRAARARWQQSAPASYSFVLQRECFCGEEMSSPVRVTVVNGVKQSVVYVDSGEPMRADWLQFFPTIEGIFTLLEKEIRESDDVEVTYDAARGFPVHAAIDAIENAIDDEYSLTISQVTL